MSRYSEVIVCISCLLLTNCVVLSYFEVRADLPSCLLRCSTPFGTVLHTFTLLADRVSLSCMLLMALSVKVAGAVLFVSDKGL